MTDHDSLDEMLKRALESRDPALIEHSLNTMFSEGLNPSFVKYLIPLLNVPNHHSHEDVVLALQLLRNPTAIDALYDAAHARFEYLNYDETLGLARKCTWALADIGTPEAKIRLEQLAIEANTLIAGYARERLLAWEKESSRKKGPV